MNATFVTTVLSTYVKDQNFIRVYLTLAARGVDWIGPGADRRSLRHRRHDEKPL